MKYGFDRTDIVIGLVDIPILELEIASEDLRDFQTILNYNQVRPLPAGARPSPRL
jgi:hypothetical protein